MASFTKISETKRKRNHQNGGRKRKNRLARKSTKSYTEIFAACGEPGKPVAASK